MASKKYTAGEQILYASMNTTHLKKSKENRQKWYTLKTGGEVEFEREGAQEILDRKIIVEVVVSKKKS